LSEAPEQRRPEIISKNTTIGKYRYAAQTELQDRGQVKASLVMACNAVKGRSEGHLWKRMGLASPLKSTTSAKNAVKMENEIQLTGRIGKRIQILTDNARSSV
jgi:hypothetical protein